MEVKLGFRLNYIRYFYFISSLIGSTWSPIINLIYCLTFFQENDVKLNTSFISFSKEISCKQIYIHPHMYTETIRQEDEHIWFTWECREFEKCVIQTLQIWLKKAYQYSL